MSLMTYFLMCAYSLPRGENQWKLLAEVEICTMKPANAMTFGGLGLLNGRIAQALCMNHCMVRELVRCCWKW